MYESIDVAVDRSEPSDAERPSSSRVLLHARDGRYWEESSTSMTTFESTIRWAMAYSNLRTEISDPMTIATASS